VRRRLLLVVLATSTLVVVAFAVPLGLLVRTVAEDRAMDAAERDAAALAPVLALTDDLEGLTAAVQRTATGAEGRLAVWLPDGRSIGGDDEDGTLVASGEQSLALARTGLGFTESVEDGMDVWVPVVLGQGAVAAIRAHVPDRLRRDGVARSWLALGGVAVALVIGSCVVADRLARSLTRDAGELSATARALAEGDPLARASASDTPELAAAGRALNLLADRIDELRSAERERVADLSHRLRTPLTALRLDAEASGSPALSAGVDRLEAAVTELVQAARRPLHGGPVAATADLAATVRERAAFWSLLAEEDGREWTVDAPNGPVPVRTDAGELEAALDALLGNVHSHTPAGTPYAVSLTVDAGRARLVVDDAGPGIADPERASVRGVSGGGSTGLGLDIAARAAAAAGGELRVGGSPAGGARVVLDLPLAS
jgi:signal transduction histidine kinase